MKNATKKAAVKEKEEIFANIRYIRISPSKLRRVANLIRGKKVGIAMAILKAVPHKGGKILEKALESVVANAVNNNQLKETRLTVSTLLVNEGPRIKRYQPRARGRIYALTKRISHINIGVAEGV